MIRFLKAAYYFARHQAYVPRTEWTAEDAAALQRFMATSEGLKFRASLQDVAFRQSEAALGETTNLLAEVGFARGERGLLAVILAMADAETLTTQEEQGADPAANQ